jgi:uncharacterized protein DUF6644
MSLDAFFEWLNGLAFSLAFRQSVWMFAILEAAHLLSLVVFAGAVLTVDLRLLGRGLTDERSVAQVARDAQPWLIGGFLGLLITGVPMVMGNGEKYHYSDIFWWKMGVLLLAVFFAFTLRRRITLADQDRVRPLIARAAGLVSIALWLFVAVGGRLIGLL